MGGVNVQRYLHLQYHDRGALEQVPQLLPGRRCINDCPLLRVCVHTLDGLNAKQKKSKDDYKIVVLWNHCRDKEHRADLE